VTECSLSVDLRGSARGFTLIEMAVAMFIIALLLGSILIPLQTQIESRNFENTQRILDQAREALLGYAAAYGYFPCPASALSNGQESSPNHATGACAAVVTGANAYIGFLPAAALGFSPTDTQGYAVDAWGLTQNRIRYAVSNVTVNGIALPFTLVSGMRSAGMSNIAGATTLLYVCNSGAGGAAMTAGTNCGTAVSLTSNALAVIWSVGPNAATNIGGTSVDELQNPNPTAGFSADRIFVSRTKSDVPGGEFDDIVTWIGPPAVFNRLIAAGQLP
jgi:prepilin-type N-terminal cleavage/methylation domain-containing protein